MKTRLELELGVKITQHVQPDRSLQDRKAALPDILQRLMIAVFVRLSAHDADEA